MVLVRKWPFFQLFFFGNLGQENVFYDILQRRSVFLDYENKKFKKPKNWDFSQGVNPWFWPKNGFFPTLFFNNIRKDNVFYDILKRKDVFLGYENKKFKKLKNLAFSKGINQWFWCKNSHFSNFFFLGNIGQENVFYDILERRNVFLGYKNKKLRKSKNWDFSIGVLMQFSNFFLANIGQENVFYHILKRKKVFLRYKNKKTSQAKTLTRFM